MSTDTMIKILINEGLNFTENECCICYERFIDNISFVDLLNLCHKVFKEKYNITEYDFFGDDDFTPLKI